MTSATKNNKYFGYNRKFLYETFGKENPSIEERTEMFRKFWMDWEVNGEFSIPARYATESNFRGVLYDSRDSEDWVKECRRILNSMGLYDFEDYIFQGPKLRFKEKGNMALARIALAELL